MITTIVIIHLSASGVYSLVGNSDVFAHEFCSVLLPKRRGLPRFVEGMDFVLGLIGS